MNTPLHNRFEICEAVDAAARDEIYRFRYRIYVEQMGLRQKYADHIRKRVVESVDELARVYAAYLNGTIVGTICGNRFSDWPPPTIASSIGSMSDFRTVRTRCRSPPS